MSAVPAEPQKGGRSSGARTTSGRELGSSAIAGSASSTE